jgi:hypothetical protein
MLCYIAYAIYRFRYTVGVRRIEWPMFTTWLAGLPDPVAVEVEADIAYLARFGRAAACLPCDTVSRSALTSLTWPRHEPMSRSDSDAGSCGA